jgi:hypothetical protein
MLFDNTQAKIKDNLSDFLKIAFDFFAAVFSFEIKTIL